MSNHKDDHAEHRDAKRDGKKKMIVRGRSIFIIQRAENKRMREIENRKERREAKALGSR